LWRVSADGREAEPFTTPQQKSVEFTSGHKLPSILPGDEWVLFVDSPQGQFDDGRILARSIRTGEEREVFRGGSAPRNFPRAWTPDGKALLFQRGTGALFNDLWLLPLDGSRTPKPYIASRFNEGRAAISPDGRLVAYESNESGRDEIYLRLFEGGSTVQVSTGGAAVPTWSANGRELFFQTDAGLTGVSIVPGSNLTVSPPHVLLDASAGVLAGVSSDGKRFLMIKRDMQRAAFTFNVVVGWFEELRRKVNGH